MYPTNGFFLHVRAGEIRYGNCLSNGHPSIYPCLRTVSGIRKKPMSSRGRSGNSTGQSRKSLSVGGSGYEVECIGAFSRQAGYPVEAFVARS